MNSKLEKIIKKEIFNIKYNQQDLILTSENKISKINFLISENNEKIEVYKKNPSIRSNGLKKELQDTNRLLNKWLKLAKNI